MIMFKYKMLQGINSIDLYKKDCSCRIFLINILLTEIIQKKYTYNKLEALKSLCHSPWSMYILNIGHRWIHDNIVFW